MKTNFFGRGDQKEKGHTHRLHYNTSDHASGGAFSRKRGENRHRFFPLDVKTLARPSTNPAAPSYMCFSVWARMCPIYRNTQRSMNAENHDRPTTFSIGTSTG